MSKFLVNANKFEDSQIINWEVIKNREYHNSSLSKLINLYIIKIYEHQHQNVEIILENKHCFNTVLVRISIEKKGEDVLSDKLLTIEIMNGIFPDRFNSKKRSNVLHLQDLYNHLCYMLNAKLPKDIEENFIKEYKDAVSLFKT